MNLNFPHREAVVVRNHELRVIRRFPVESDVKTRAGARVTADQVLGRADARLIATRIPIADQLDCPPHDVARHLMRPVGSPFGAGEPMARVRRGIRNVVVSAPIAGTLVEVDTDSGVALLAPTGADEVRALVPGDVEYVDGRRAVVIRTIGSRVLGIIGLGNPASGPLKIAVERADQELEADSVTADLAGALVVAGSWMSAEALKRLVQVGAAGVITGGFVEREIASFLGWQAEDRLAPWRPIPGDRALGEGLPCPLAIVATEGFGPLPMTASAFDLMRDLAGRWAVLFPATRVVGPLSRPELVIPDEAALDEDGETTVAALTEGTTVRLTDQANIGKLGQITGEPRRERFSDGNLFDVVDVQLPTGATRTICVANLEVIA